MKSHGKLTAQELMEFLSQVDPNAEVRIAYYDSGRDCAVETIVCIGDIVVKDSCNLIIDTVN